MGLAQVSRQSSDIMVTSVAIIYGDVEQTIIVIIIIILLPILLILLRDAGCARRLRRIAAHLCRRICLAEVNFPKEQRVATTRPDTSSFAATLRT